MKLRFEEIKQFDQSHRAANRKVSVSHVGTRRKLKEHSPPIL